MYCSSCGVDLPGGPPIKCPDCGARHWSNSKPCGGALVVEHGRVLLARRNHEPWHGRWDIPGGFCEIDEHPIDTAEREVFEETGLRVRVTGFLGIWLDDYIGDEVTANIYYHATPLGSPEGEPDPVEVGELRWFEPDDLPLDELAFPAHAGEVMAAWREAYRSDSLATPLPDRPPAPRRRR